MARGRRRDEWERTTTLIHWIAGTFSGTRVDPDAINPVPRLEDLEAEDLDPDAEAAEGWANLRAAFTQLARQRKHGGRQLERRDRGD